MASYIDYERKCSAVNGITQSDVSQTIRHLEYWKRPLLRHERECLEFCRRLLVRLSREVLKNASIVVRLTLFKVILTAGDGFSRFEVSLDRFGTPKYRQVFDWKRNIPKKYNEVYSLARRTTNQPRPESKTYRLTYPRYDSIDDVKSSLTANIQTDFTQCFKFRCQPSITFKDINDAITAISYKSYLRLKDECLLRYCISLLRERDMTIWQNASISVYGTNVNVFFTSGYETTRFEVTLDDQGKPTYIETTHTRRRYMSIGYGSMDHDDCVDLRSPTSSECNIVAERPYIKACYPFITFKNIHDVITHFEKSPNGLDSVDASCLRYCLSVVGKNDAKTLKNARISVFGRYIRVVFLAGTQKRQIEISLDENYKPICQDVFFDDADKEIKSLVDDAMSESNVNLEDFVSTERPYIKQCHPFISAKNISDVTTFFEETVEGLDPVDRICLGKCFTLVEKHDIKTLSSALLSVFGKRMKVIFTAGGERNKFEVTLDENYTPICRKILVPNEISDDLEDRKHEEILEECSPRISFKHIHDVVLRLEASPTEVPVGDMRCLKHCYKIVEEQEHGILDNTIITVLGMIITVIFKSGMEVNEFEITLDDHGRPICHHTANPRQTDESVTDEELTSHQFENFGEIEEDCSPCISFNHIHSIVQRLESSGKEVHDGDMRCLKYCYTLMKEQEQEVLENAKLVVYGIYCTIIFKSGIELNVFEITLNDQNEPICREIRKIIESSRGRSKTKTVSSSIDNEETTTEVSCQPFITAKHINDAITELTSPSETKTLKDEACLRYCFTLLREKDASIWKNARISVYGVNLTIIFKSGVESHQFEVTLNDQHEPMHVETYNRQGERYSLVPYSNRDAIPSRRVFEDFMSTRRPYVKQCHPSISAKNISDVIKLFEESQEGLDPVDRICLKHCFTVLEKYDSKTLYSALLSVFGKFVKVVFTAGSERNQFEITLDENYTPICRKISTVDESQEDSEKPEHKEIVRNCSPHISFQHIRDVILQLESSRTAIPEGDIRCLKYCFTIVEQQEAGVLDNAIITVLGMIITVIFKSGMEVNMFEITLNDHGNPIYHQTKKPGQESSTDDYNRLKLRQLSQFGEIVEDCHPYISFENIHKIVRRLEPLEEEQLLHDGDMKCVKYCYTLVNKYEKEVLENAKITVYGRSVTIVLKCGIEVNVFEITLNDQNEPICREMRKTVGEIYGLAQKSALFNWDTHKDLVPSKRPYVKDCHQYISAKDISDVIKHFEESPEGLDPIDRICLRHCFSVIEKYDTKTLSSALISVFGKCIKVVFTAGAERNHFEITLDEKYTPICRKIPCVEEEKGESKHKEIVRNCSQHISLKDIHDVILQLESSGIEIPEGDMRCLKYCYTFVEKQEPGVLHNAIITVLGMIMTVIFKSGMEENQFEIILDDHGNPICHLTKKPEETDEDGVGDRNRRREQNSRMLSHSRHKKVLTKV